MRSQSINIRAILLLVLFVPITNIYSQGFSKKELPDWFFAVSPTNQIGSIGYAHKYSADYEENTLHLAKLNAIDALKHYINEREFISRKRDVFAMVMGSTEEMTFSSGTLRARGQFEGESMYFYNMVFEPNQPFQAATPKPKKVSSSCDFQKCSPSWLCSQVQQGLTGFLGISFRASSPGRQLEISKKNSLEIMQYSLGVDIVGKEEYYKLNSSIIKVNYRRKDFDLKKKSPTTEAYLYTKEQCFRGDTLFSWQVSNEIPPYKNAKNLGWINNPQQDGVFGAVGFSRKDYTGFFSRQLRHAYEDGIASLAKAYESKITVEETHTGSTERGRKSIIDIEVEFQKKFKPKILGVFVDEKEQMFVWVAADESLKP